jgi:putative membrane protein
MLPLLHTWMGVHAASSTIAWFALTGLLMLTIPPVVRVERVGAQMIYAGLVFALLAALLHVYIFVMESLTWTSPRTRAAFGTTEEEAETTKLLAFNQGFYNLFLAVVTAVGVVIGGFGHYAAALALIFAGTGSMLAAAVVLLASAPDKARAAVTQGAFPLIAIVLIVVHLAM